MTSEVTMSPSSQLTPTPKDTSASSAVSAYFDMDIDQRKQAPSQQNFQRPFEFNSSAFGMATSQISRAHDVNPFDAMSARQQGTAKASPRREGFTLPPQTAPNYDAWQHRGHDVGSDSPHLTTGFQMPQVQASRPETRQTDTTKSRGTGLASDRVDRANMSSPQLSAGVRDISVQDRSSPVRIAQPAAHKLPPNMSLQDLLDRVPDLGGRSLTPSTASLNSANSGQHDQIVEQISPIELAAVLSGSDTEKSLVIDMRPFASFKQARVRGAVNIGIPATLLKRPAFTLQKIRDSLSTDDAKGKFDRWREMECIVFYDGDTHKVGDGTALGMVAKKFTFESWAGQLYTVKGGYAAIARDQAELLDKDPIVTEHTDQAVPMAMSSPFGGSISEFACKLPTKQTAANPFFNNIRQNQDLIGGVGEPLPLHVPEVSSEVRRRLPRWLRRLAFSKDGPHMIAQKFLKIEQEELQRMKGVLGAGKSTQDGGLDERHSIAAGIERGDKNRYNNIWPFENARVRLQDVTNLTSDYINASHIHKSGSEKFYIATQGPLPATTKDFWQLVWENDIRVVVMLTKTVEEGQAKCHAYWEDNELAGQFQLDQISEETIESQYRSTDTTTLTIRKISVSRSDRPLEPPREISHIQFKEWPDLLTVEPRSILAIVQEAQNAAIDHESPVLMKRRKSLSSSVAQLHHSDSSPATRPTLTHCSAGCGRTGVFCTVDTVVSKLRKQLDEQRRRLVTGSKASPTESSSATGLSRQSSSSRKRRSREHDPTSAFMPRSTSSISLTPNDATRSPHLQSDTPQARQSCFAPIAGDTGRLQAAEGMLTPSLASEPTGSDESTPRSTPPTSATIPGSASAAAHGGSGVAKAIDLDRPGVFGDDDEIDLVEQTVRSFRDQRISMVQTLRQFVLCYDAALLYATDLAKDLARMAKSDADADAATATAGAGASGGRTPTQ